MHAASIMILLPLGDALNAAGRLPRVGRPFKAGNVFDRTDIRRVATVEFRDAAIAGKMAYRIQGN